MTTPQKQKGFTAIPNEILEQLMKVRLNGTQLRIVLTVVRYTYGFNRVEHRLSDSYLAKAIGVSRTNLNRDIQPLFKMNILIAVKRSKADKTGSVLSLNKDYDTWVLSKSITAIEIDDTAAIKKETSSAIIPDSSKALIFDSANSIDFDTQEKKELNKDIKKEKKESAPNKTITANKNIKANKTSFGTYGWVLLSEKEHKCLLSDFDTNVVEHYIAVVDSRAQANGNKYGWNDWNLKIRQAIKESWGGKPSKQSYVEKNYDVDF